jgi:hypothetical protein
VRYEVTTIDTLYRRFTPRDTRGNAALFDHFVANAAAAQSSLSAADRKRKQPFADRVDVVREGFAVVSVVDLQTAPGTNDFSSEYEASEWLRQAVARDPAVHGRFQVVPAAERDAA